MLAPTGTIAFMMDCDTTGVEPDIALVKYKKLVGGGMLKIVNQTVPMALRRLGYAPGADRRDHRLHRRAGDDRRRARSCATSTCPSSTAPSAPRSGKRSIHWMGHVRMMGAVQPFLSGAISKTVNLPEDATVEDVMTAYIEGWQLGLKALAVYRDGCKRTQPLNTGKKPEGAKVISLEEARPRRVKLPDERRALTHKFSIAGHEGYLTVGSTTTASPARSS